MKHLVDVLCVGHASYDLVFGVDHHPGPDEKSSATMFTACGGGPAANAAVTVSRLGYKIAFAGYLGNDIYGQKHFQELKDEGVMTDFAVRGAFPTPLSVILVKPDGKRSVVNYRGSTPPIAPAQIDFFDLHPRAILFDGHEPDLSQSLIRFAKERGIVTVLDAGSVHEGTCALAGQVDHVVASEKFSRDFTGEKDAERAAVKLSRHAPSVVITLGQDGLVWRDKKGMGRLRGFDIDAVDTTGAGDAFHGAFAAGLADGKNWEDLLRYSSAVGALCCTKYGGRPAIPTAAEVYRFLED